MWWGDYTAKPAHQYDYTRRAAIRHAEDPVDAGRSRHGRRRPRRPGDGTHGIYFNRGVAASQAYAREVRRDRRTACRPDKRAEAMTWLSRGLHEAMIAFITQDASPQLAIRAAVYEFTEPAVLAAFAAGPRRPAPTSRSSTTPRATGAGNGNRQAIADARARPRRC